MDVVVKHLKNLIDEMVKEEGRMKDKMLKKLALLTEEIGTLNRELNKAPFKVFFIEVMSRKLS